MKGRVEIYQRVLATQDILHCASCFLQITQNLNFSIIALPVIEGEVDFVKCYIQTQRGMKLKSPNSLGKNRCIKNRICDVILVRIFFLKEGKEVVFCDSHCYICIAPPNWSETGKFGYVEQMSWEKPAHAWCYIFWRFLPPPCAWKQFFSKFCHVLKPIIPDISTESQQFQNIIWANLYKAKCKHNEGSSGLCSGYHHNHHFSDKQEIFSCRVSISGCKQTTTKTTTLRTPQWFCVEPFPSEAWPSALGTTLGSWRFLFQRADLYLFCTFVSVKLVSATHKTNHLAWLLADHINFKLRFCFLFIVFNLCSEIEML